MTNRKRFKLSSQMSHAPLCEWEPDKGRLARLSDKAHGYAEFVCDDAFDGSLLVCRDCARRFEAVGLLNRLVSTAEAA